MDNIYVKLNNVNDYETLAKDCAYMDKESSHFDQMKGENTASITPADCLSCSGCLTTSEELLVNDQTSQKVMDFVNNEKECDVDYFIVGNDLALVSIALANQISVLDIRKHFQNKGIPNLISNRIGRKILLYLMLEYSFEFTDKKYPLFTSECPSFVLYLKKQLEPGLDKFLFPFLSSDQLTKLLVLETMKKDCKILGLSQCVDKKLENINNKEIKDVDIIGTPYELFSEHRIKYDFELDLKKLENEYLMKGLNGSLVYKFIKKYTIKKFGFTTKEFKIRYKKIRTGFIEIFSEHNGKELAKGLRVEGINNIVFLANKFKTKTNSYIFAEMMACPEGCTFGSGLNKFEEPENDLSLKQKLLYEKLLKWKHYKTIKNEIKRLDSSFVEKYNAEDMIKDFYLKFNRDASTHLKKINDTQNSDVNKQTETFDW
eukprot:GAHX01000342.1.p1 GENE.GAHX01000342.1~~GAHX01000342.1.p1  ORF type:complete len:430 (-),score=96.43 GAHX01000342.1:675-1964(-)